MGVPRWLPVALALLACTAVVGAARWSLLAAEEARGGSCSARQVHVALGDTYGSVRIVWSTEREGCDPSVVFAQTRNLGPEKGDDDTGVWLTGAEGYSYTLTEDAMCSGRARKNRFEKHFHTATISSLLAGERYMYHIAGDVTERLLVAPVYRDTSRLDFLVLGDMGWGHKKKHPMAPATAATLMSEHTARPVDLVLHVGDISYADGKPGAWDTFMDLIEPIAAEVPYMVAIGNHEYAYKGGSERDASGAREPYRPDWGNYGDESGGECGASAASTFLMPAGQANPAAALPSAGQQGARPRGAPVAQQAVQRSALATAAHAVSSASRWVLDAVNSAGSWMRAAGGGDGRSQEEEEQGEGQQQQQQQRAGSGNSGGSGSSDSLAPQDNPPFWYSFEYGPVHFTVLSTEHDVSPGSTQYAWLQADLQSVHRCATPWLVVLQHRPMYVVFPHKSNLIVGDHLREYLEDLFLEYKVDLVLSGHVHSNYRSCVVAREKCSSDNSGITHIVIGTGGHKLSDVEEQQRLWMRAAVLEHGFGRFSIDGDRLSYEFIRSSDGSVSDSAMVLAQVPRSGCRGWMAAAGSRSSGSGGDCTGSDGCAAAAAGQ
ncbi:hypothetical protein FOA52_014449 [Chlamydomonas sp. UWO 241]|nr:hypothetical protein FOA52_014449 [Chlamydomonas sp. UWO 241]